MKIRRPTLGDRMDGAQERNHRRRQSDADLVIEQAQYKDWERGAAIGRRQHEDSQPYRGSRLESDHRNGGG